MGQNDEELRFPSLLSFCPPHRSAQIVLAFNEMNEGETFGRLFRRGRETRAEHAFPVLVKGSQRPSSRAKCTICALVTDTRGG